METSLLTPQDIKIKESIEARSVKRSINKFYERHSFKEFRTFKTWIQKLEFDALRGISYDCQNKTKTCLKCGNVMPIQYSLWVHQRKCIPSSIKCEELK